MAIKKSFENGEACYRVQVEALNKYTGKRIQKSKWKIPTLYKAKLIEKELWEQCRNSRPDSQIQTWGHLVDCYLKEIEKLVSEKGEYGFVQKTLENKRYRLPHVDDWASIPIEKFSKPFVNRKLVELERAGMTRASTIDLLKEIKAVLNYGVEIGVLASNPVEKLKWKSQEKEIPCLNEDEVNKLLWEARIQNHPYFPVWLLSVFTGLRRSELAGLKWEDIDFNRRLLTVNKQKIPGEGLVQRTKTKRIRKTPIPLQIIPLLQEMKMKSRSTYVIDLDDKAWESGRQAEVLRNFCEKIGILSVTHHSLRASFITQSLANNVPLNKVQASAGHMKATTTDGYNRISGLPLVGATDALSFRIPNEAQIDEINSKVIPLRKT